MAKSSKSKKSVKSSKRERSLRFLNEYSVTVTLNVSATTKDQALVGVRHCLGMSESRITRISAKAGESRRVVPADASLAAIRSLRAFAEQHGEVQFAHMCTAAIGGEEWAVKRLGIDWTSAGFGDTTWDGATLLAIRTTNTTRPNVAPQRKGAA